MSSTTSFQSIPVCGNDPGMTRSSTSREDLFCFLGFGWALSLSLSFEVEESRIFLALASSSDLSGVIRGASADEAMDKAAADNCAESDPEMILFSQDLVEESADGLGDEVDPVEEEVSLVPESCSSGELSVETF